MTDIGKKKKKVNACQVQARFISLKDYLENHVIKVLLYLQFING